MNMNLMTLATLALCSIAGAQVTQEHKQVQVFERAVAGPADRLTTAPFRFMASEFDWREEQVKALPYSAEAVNESTQTLADGNKISRKNTTLLYRDSEGRTRREETINAIGPWSSGTPHKLIFVNDPVAKVNWVIDPQTKEARKMTRSVTIESTGPGGDTVSFAPSTSTIESGVKIERETGDVFEARAGSENVAIGVTGSMVGGVPGKRVHVEHGVAHAIPAVPGRGGPAFMFLREGAENANTESLGKRVFEGVEAQGTKTTYTTPAGEIGNERPIVTESERWYSDELKATMMTRYSDPRQGETIYKLTNLRRGEPDAALFQPPSDYKVIEAGSQVIHMKIRGSKE
jgi:hypothetical protein